MQCILPYTVQMQRYKGDPIAPKPLSQLDLSLSLLCAIIPALIVDLLFAACLEDAQVY